MADCTMLVVYNINYIDSRHILEAVSRKFAFGLTMDKGEMKRKNYV